MLKIKAIQQKCEQMLHHASDKFHVIEHTKCPRRKLSHHSLSPHRVDISITIVPGFYPLSLITSFLRFCHSGFLFLLLHVLLTRGQYHNKIKQHLHISSIMSFSLSFCLFVSNKQVRSWSHWFQCWYENRNSHRQRAVRCTWLTKMAIRCMERWCYISQSYGEWRCCWVSKNMFE